MSDHECDECGERLDKCSCNLGGGGGGGGGSSRDYPRYVDPTDQVEGYDADTFWK